MNTKYFALASKFALFCLALLWLNAAQAGYPASVAGTWSAIGNQTTGPLRITQRASAALCQRITGSMFTNPASPIEGYYCPKSGRIVFARKNESGKAMQFYKGVVARGNVAKRMGGSFLIWNAEGGGAFDEGVEYNFRATKP